MAKDRIPRAKKPAGDKPEKPSPKPGPIDQKPSQDRAKLLPLRKVRGLGTGLQKVALSRMTITEMIYHQQPDQQPSVIQSRFVRWLSNDEQNFVRQLSVGTEWRKLDTGWVKAVGMLVIRNNEDRLGTIPTTEQAEEQAGKTLEISIQHKAGEPHAPSAIIRPGESARFEPGEEIFLYIRCRKGEVKTTINAVPQ